MHDLASSSDENLCPVAGYVPNVTAKNMIASKLAMLIQHRLQVWTPLTLPPPMFRLA